MWPRSTCPQVRRGVLRWVRLHIIPECHKYGEELRRSSLHVTNQVPVPFVGLSLRFRVLGSGFRVQVEGSGLRVQV